MYVKKILSLFFKNLNLKFTIIFSFTTVNENIVLSIVYIVSNQVNFCNFETPLVLSSGVDFIGNLSALTANMSHHVEHYIDLKFPEHLT